MTTTLRDYYEEYCYLNGTNGLPINGVKTSGLFIGHFSYKNFMAILRVCLVSNSGDRIPISKEN